MLKNVLMLGIMILLLMELEYKFEYLMMYK